MNMQDTAYATLVDLLAELILQYGMPVVNRKVKPMLRPSRRYIDMLIRQDDEIHSDWLLTLGTLGTRQFTRVA